LGFPILGQQLVYHEIQTSNPGSCLVHSLHSHSVRIHHEPKEVLPRPHIGLCLFRGSSSDSGNCPDGSDIYSTPIAAASGCPSSHHSDDTACLTKDMTHSVALPLSVEPDQTVLRVYHLSHSRCAPPPVVGDARKPPIFAPVPSSRTVCHHNRCLLSQLGGYSIESRG
jgi:hypothetical protein